MIFYEILLFMEQIAFFLPQEVNTVFLLYANTVTVTSPSLMLGVIAV